MTDKPNRIVEFDRLNTLGKAVYVAGTAIEVATSVVAAAVGAVGVIWDEAERAFKDGSKPDVDDARIIEESDRLSP